MSDVDPGFGSDGGENSDGRIYRVRVDQGDGPVQRHGGGSEVFEDVGVVEPVRIIEEWVFAFCSRKVEVCSVLWDTIDMTVIRKVNIQGKRFRA